MVAVMNEPLDNHARHPQAARERPDRRSPPSTPRWAYVFAIILIVLVLLLIVSFLARGLPGPNRHTSSGGAGGQTTTETYVSSAARPMLVSSAICDLVADAGPCSVTNTAPSRMKTSTTLHDRGDAQ